MSDIIISDYSLEKDPNLNNYVHVLEKHTLSSINKDV